jgi:tripartite-type tricarboxylate transporter receptor subunit TctC
MRNIPFRRLLAPATVVLGAALLVQGAIAQEAFPSRAVRIVVPNPAGGPTDVAARMVGQRLSDLWKQPVIVDNRAGASGAIGSEFVAKSAPDGYTLIMGNSASHGAYEVLNPAAPYRTLRDFAAVAFIASAPIILTVRSSLEAKNLQEYVALARANPGKLNYASSAVGSANQFGQEALNIAAGIKTVHVPFNGNAPALQAIMAGSVDAFMTSISGPVTSAIKDGRIRALALAGAQRTVQMPELPTTAELGYPGVEFEPWYGLLAPVATPAAILDRINADTNRLMDGPETELQLRKMGYDRKLGSRAAFATFLKSGQERIQRVVKEAGIKAE